MSLPEKPNFIIAGADRCATRWLRINLGHHPDVFTLSYEANYFSNEETMAKLGRQGYLAMFKGWNGEPIVGEASPQYAMPANKPAEIAGRIAWSYPDIRIFLLIRNPYDRAFSAMLEAIRRGQIPADTQIEQLDPETLTELQLLENSSYDWALNQYQDTLGDQFKALVYDDLVEDPEAFYDSALVHLGLEPGFRPPDLATPLFSSRRIRASVPEPDEAHRQGLLALWEDTTRGYEERLGRKLPGWHPN